VGVPQAVNYFWVLKDPQCAYQVLTALRKQFGTQAALECVDGLDSTFSVYLGHPGAGLVLANRVLNSPAAPASAVAWATAGAALASAQLGRFNDLRVYVERGLDAVQFAENGVLRNLLGYAQVIALPLQGAAVEAVRVAERLTQSAHLQQPGAAVGDAVLGKALMSSGAVSEAVERLWQAVAALERNGLSSWEFLAATTLCEAFSVLGRVPEAEETLERVERCFGPDLAGFEGEWILARAWLMAARGDLREARMLAIEAADAAAAASFRATECQALIASVRFGDHTVGRRLARLASAAPEILVLGIAVDHAAALARHDGNALEEVALRYERAGLRAVAADAFAHAAAAYNVLGVRNRYGATMAHAAKLASDCGGLRTIGLADMTNPLPLTIREREIANLLAQGLTNKQIAERLVVSVRTVEGHIYRACTKINVADREALAEAFVGHQQLH
jgi:DNA-binding NarL/FixJ family response regulator